MLALVRGCLWERARPQLVQNLCIYRVGNLGDILCALPAINMVRQAYPQARLTLVTSPGKKGMPGALELLGGAPWLDDLFVYYQEDIRTWRQRWNLAKQLRQKKFDVWIEFPSDLATFGVLMRNMVLAKMAKARWAQGWHVNTIQWGARAQSEGKVFPSEVDRLLHLAEGLGIPAVPPQFLLALTAEHACAVDSELQSAVPPETSMVAIAPGAKRPANKWPLDRYAEVAEALTAQGYFVLLLGGANDHEACARITSRVGDGVLNLAGRLSVLQSCEALRRCAFAICNDSGVQHMAAAVSTPCISIFSVRDMRGKWRPYGSQHVVLEKEVACHTCYLEECPYDNLCVKQIQVSDVVAAAQEVSARARAGVRPETFPSPATQT
jgi:ADP-heptose:LPS heptosyltransferase